MYHFNNLSNEELITELQRRINQGADEREAESYMRLQEEVRYLSTQLRASESGKSQFLSNVRNEINNPLTSILGLASFIGDMSGGDKINRMSALIYDQAFELDFQIRNIIPAEIEMGDINPSSAKVDVVSLVEDQIKYLKSKQEQSGVHIKTHLPDLLKFPTDSYLLQTIFLNLLANAIEFSGRNKLVVVEAFEKDEHLIIEVRDFGVGIDLENQQIIFLRFHQSEFGVTKSHRGHGLGLTIVHELVNILEGSVHVQSTPGHGTTITIKVPPLISGSAKDISAHGNEVLFTEDVEF